MVQGELWKERLAFASGNILAWGIVFLTFWPAASRIQTGMHIHFWTINWPQQGVAGSLWLYWAVTALLTLAITSTVLAVVHILARGLWLGLYIEKQSSTPSLVSAADGRTDVLDRVCLLTYKAIFLLIGLTGLWISLTIPILISAGVEFLMVSYLSLSVKAAGWLTRTFLALMLLAIEIPIFRRLFHSKRFETSIGRQGCMKLITYAGYAGSVFAFLAVWFAVMEVCYSVELKVDKNVFHQATNDVVEVNVSLGGATSAVNDAGLTLLDSVSNTLSLDLILNDLGHGQYISYIPCSTLAPGRYTVALEYPHVSLDLSFPFLHRKNLLHAWVLVVP